MILMDKAGHLVSTEGAAELHGFARSLGLRRTWYQDKKRPHYDLTTARAKVRAQRLGAVMVPSRELVRRAWWQCRAGSG